MKKCFITLCLALFSHQTLAVTVAGIEFSEIANTLVSSQGSYLSNVDGVTIDSSGNVISKSVTSPDAVVDGNAASYVMSGSTPATLNVSFGQSLNVADRNLTILVIGNDAPHSIGLSLLGSGDTSSQGPFTLDSFGSPEKNLVGYTDFNSVSQVTSGEATTGEAGSTPPDSTVSLGSTDTTVTWGIYAMNITLADFFDSGASFTGVQLDISGYSAVPSLVGTTAVVPVPAAVWLFGSGLIGLVGVARRKK